VADGARPVARTAPGGRRLKQSIDVAEHDDAYVVTVRDDGGATEHAVTVPDAYLEELGLADVDRATLVDESFRFLLEREPKESIMRSFELPVIERYFSEFPDEIRKRLAAR
jgi:bifunctional DNA-binding transcriptional regulator/antitoxin component of YhaV-PrlF toxin-antitoxin module